MAIHFEIVRDGSSFFARAGDGGQFEVGRQVLFRNKRTGEETRGLANNGSKSAKQLLYRAADFVGTFGFWAEFIEPTALGEGQSFITLNTYDRARFTFGFAQLAAHVADGDFILWFRDMLGRAEALDYFPNLALHKGKIVKVEEGKRIPLETAETTRALMRFLNPSLSSVDDDEVIAAAKLVHWTTSHPGTQTLQVQHMVATAKRLMEEADRRLGLDGADAALCCAILDIRHQGRGTFAEMQKALGEKKPLDALIEVGAFSYPERVKTLRNALKSRKANFSQKHWSREDQSFS